MSRIPTLSPSAFRRVSRVVHVLEVASWVAVGTVLLGLWELGTEDRSWTLAWGAFLVVTGIRLFLLPVLDPERTQPDQPAFEDDGYRGSLPAPVSRRRP